MAILDIFKKKKKPPVAKKESVGQKEEVKSEGIKARAKVSDRAFYVFKYPHITEKATALTGKNQYIFNVKPKANKIEIKKALEELYGVEVVAVRIINIPAKKRRLGRISGWKQGYKKAIIRIKEGQKIEVLPR